MTQNERMTQLFKDLFNGDPWLESSLIGILSRVSAEKAARKPQHVTNSIWELTVHVAKWREVVLARIHGAPKNTPDHNYYFPVEDTSESAWKDALGELEKSQRAWLGFLESVSEEKLDEIYQGSNYTVNDLIFGIMQHDAYHLGQIALLAKYEL